MLILFLAPPTRLFAAWTAPVADRRPALLVVGLVVVFTAVLFVPALSNYFGLAGAARPVFQAVLPALVAWFVALTLAYRFRLLDRMLGLDDLPRPRCANLALRVRRNESVAALDANPRRSDRRSPEGE